MSGAKALLLNKDLGVGRYGMRFRSNIISVRPHDHGKAGRTRGLRGTRTWRSMEKPAILCRTLGSRDFIRVPSRGQHDHQKTAPTHVQTPDRSIATVAAPLPWIKMTRSAMASSRRGICHFAYRLHRNPVLGEVGASSSCPLPQSGGRRDRRCPHPPSLPAPAP